MKRTVISILVAAMAMLSAVPVWGQSVVSEDGTISSYDNLILGKKEAPWKFEFSVRQVAALGWLPELATVGLRKENVVWGLGAGHSMWTIDSHTAAKFYSIPFYAYNRIYFPMGNRNRFFFYTDEFLGYTTTYKVHSFYEEDLAQKGTGKFFFSWQPGFALRMWGKSNLFLGIVLTTTFETPIPLFGLHLGFAL
jgi:hypothetical protein